ncbi:MAG: DUF2868 domain-containing protein [Desulfocapsaceae bacterium]|jgi:hypothetical protein|nr:DUF2868 domain-containing protein [Desulfocapsaceae bacterium]
MKSFWTYSDIFDLEYFFYRDHAVGDSTLHHRDRSIFLDLEKQNPGEQDTTSKLLHAWLEEQRNVTTGQKEHLLPGALVDEMIRLMMVVLPITGVLAGLLGGLAFFSYSGTTPVNVFHFLFLFIFSQLILALLLLLRLLFNRIGLLKQSFPITFRLYTTLAARLADRAGQRLRASVSTAKRDTYQQILSLSRTVHRKYGLLLYWPLFSLSQCILVGVNAGLLGATLFRVMTSDLAFGWQSTLQFSSTALHKMVQILALPWSWLLPEAISYPSLSAIEGSRIILKDGIYHLATENLVSWWPFLLLCLLVYGLLFRLLLAVLASWCQRRNLAKIKLDSSDGLSVIRRMHTPLVSTQATGKENSKPLETFHSKSTAKPVQASGAAFSSPFPLVLLIACDIFHQSDMNPFLSFLQRRGFSVERSEVMMEDHAADLALLQNIEQNKPDKTVGMFLVLESWMPPIGEVLEFIRSLRKAVHTATPIYIGLIGKPSPAHSFTSPTSQDCTIWKRKLDTLSDPYLKMFPYSEDDSP